MGCDVMRDIYVVMNIPGCLENKTQQQQQKLILYSKSGHVLEQIGQRGGYGVSIHGDTQIQTGCGPGQSVPDDPT